MEETRPLLLAVAKEFATKHTLGEPVFVGKGAFKETYSIVSQSDGQRALKLTDSSKHNLIRSQREISTLLRCDSPYICRLYDYGIFEPSNGGKFYFSIEEFLDGGTLTEQIKLGVLPPNIVRNYAIALVQGIDYLRSINVVHRDVKPDNIMFRQDSTIPILVDLGLARDLSETSLTPSWLSHGPGTPYYSAPEQLNNEKHLINWRTDQFSLGIVLGICLTGKHPFEEDGQAPSETVARISERKSCTSKFYQEATVLGFGWITKMLDPWPIRRYQFANELLASIGAEEG